MPLDTTNWPLYTDGTNAVPAATNPPQPPKYWSDVLAKQLIGTSDTGEAKDGLNRGAPVDTDQNRVLNYQDVTALNDKPINLVLPLLDEVPQTCNAACADQERIRREQCTILRKRVAMWLRKNNCPSTLGPAPATATTATTKSGCTSCAR